MAGDFNAGKLKSILPHFYQHVKSATRGGKKKPLDHHYSTHRDAYKALPLPPFGKSDNNYILLIPAYNQKLKQYVPVTCSIRKWSDDADPKLQDCFAAQTGICSGILPMALRSTPHLSLALSTSASRTLSTQ